MQGTLLHAGKLGAASVATKAAATTVAARSGAQALRPQAPPFAVKTSANLAHSTRASASAIADAPAPSVASAERESEPSTPSSQNRSSINDLPLLFKFIVPAIAIGPLMGHNGEHLAAIKESCGALVQVARQGSATWNPRERMVLVGAEDGAAAKRAAAEILATIERERATDRLQKNGYPGKVFFKMVIPPMSAGKVLGPGGETISSICVNSQVSVVVEGKANNAAFVPFRYVNFLAPSIAKLADAIGMVLDLVAVDERYHTGIRDVSSVAFKVIEVPEKRVGAILGPQGAYVQALSSMLRCKIGVAEGKDAGGKRRVRYVSVWGPPASVGLALDVICACTGTVRPSGGGPKDSATTSPYKHPPDDAASDMANLPTKEEEEEE